jgi:hypothetical protein
VIEDGKTGIESDVGFGRRNDAVVARERVRVAKERRVSVADLGPEINELSDTSPELQLEIVEPVESGLDEPVALEPAEGLPLELGRLSEERVHVSPRHGLERFVLLAEAKVGLVHVDVVIAARRVSIVQIEEVDFDPARDVPREVDVEEHRGLADLDRGAGRNRAELDRAPPLGDELRRERRPGKAVVLGPSVVALDLSRDAELDAGGLFERLLLFLGERERGQGGERKGEVEGAHPITVKYRSRSVKERPTQLW